MSNQEGQQGNRGKKLLKPITYNKPLIPISGETFNIDPTSRAVQDDIAIEFFKDPKGKNRFIMKNDLLRYDIQRLMQLNHLSKKEAVAIFKMGHPEMTISDPNDNIFSPFSTKLFRLLSDKKYVAKAEYLTHNKTLNRATNLIKYGDIKIPEKNEIYAKEGAFVCPVEKKNMPFLKQYARMMGVLYVFGESDGNLRNFAINKKDGKPVKIDNSFFVNRVNIFARRHKEQNLTYRIHGCAQSKDFFNRLFLDKTKDPFPNVLQPEITPEDQKDKFANWYKRSAQLFCEAFKITEDVNKTQDILNNDKNKEELFMEFMSGVNDAIQLAKNDDILDKIKNEGDKGNNALIIEYFKKNAEDSQIHFENSLKYFKALRNKEQYKQKFEDFTINEKIHNPQEEMEEEKKNNNNGEKTIVNNRKCEAEKLLDGLNRKALNLGPVINEMKKIRPMIQSLTIKDFKKKREEEYLPEFKTLKEKQDKMIEDIAVSLWSNLHEESKYCLLTYAINHSKRLAEIKNPIISEIKMTADNLTGELKYNVCLTNGDQIDFSLGRILQKAKSFYKNLTPTYQGHHDDNASHAGYNELSQAKLNSIKDGLNNGLFYPACGEDRASKHGMPLSEKQILENFQKIGQACQWPEHGSTMTMASLDKEGNLKIATLGDSPVYLVIADNVIKLTEDMDKESRRYRAIVEGKGGKIEDGRLITAEEYGIATFGANGKQGTQGLIREPELYNFSRGFQHAKQLNEILQREGILKAADNINDLLQKGIAKVIVASDGFNYKKMGKRYVENIALKLKVPREGDVVTPNNFLPQSVMDYQNRTEDVLLAEENPILLLARGEEQKALTNIQGKNDLHFDDKTMIMVDIGTTVSGFDGFGGDLSAQTGYDIFSQYNKKEIAIQEESEEEKTIVMPKPQEKIPKPQQNTPLKKIPKVQQNILEPQEIKPILNLEQPRPNRMNMTDIENALRGVMCNLVQQEDSVKIVLSEKSYQECFKDVLFTKKSGCCGTSYKKINNDICQVETVNDVYSNLKQITIRNDKIKNFLNALQKKKTGKNK